MKLPTTFDDRILTLEEADSPHRSPAQAQVYSLVFPPIGFFPFYGMGNGDDRGFYWPVGREEGPPLIAFSSHDTGSLIPEHSSIEALYQCELARSGNDEEDDPDSLEDYRALAILADGKAPVEHDVRGNDPCDFKVLLDIDQTSPFYLCAVGDIELANNDLESAEHRYRRSLELLPEYVAAHFGLAYVLRRQRRTEEATIHLRESLIGPLVFYGGSFWAKTCLPGSFRRDWAPKALLWLQQSKVIHETLVNDPFVRRAKELAFQTGLAVNPDIDVLQSIVEEYQQRSSYGEAARVWQLVADRAAVETSSFRERYKLTPLSYGTRLAELFDLAGNASRAALVRNMLGLMKDPEGRHL